MNREKIQTIVIIVLCMCIVFISLANSRDYSKQSDLGMSYYVLGVTSGVHACLVDRLYDTHLKSEELYEEADKVSGIDASEYRKNRQGA